MDAVSCLCVCISQPVRKQERNLNALMFILIFPFYNLSHT